MVGVHTTRIAGNFREGRHPVRTHLFCHQQEGVDDIAFTFVIDQDTQRVGCTVCIPNPVVGIERTTSVFMYLAVESTVIASVFTQVDRTFVATVQGGVEYHLVVFRSALSLYLAEGIVPVVTGDLGNHIDIIGGNLTFQVLLSLFFADK